jgi:lipoprotein-releasing system permease protein
MKDSVALSLALRYLRKRRRKFAAFITWVSVIGLSLGVLVLTVVLSVMNGFDAELKTRILGTVPHILLPERTAAEVAVAALQDHPEIRSVDDFFTGAGMVTRGGGVHPVSVYGIVAGEDGGLSQLSQHMVDGSLADLDNPGRNLIMGAPLANLLGLLAGDQLALVLSEPTPAGLNPQLLRFHLAGTFELGAELDYSLVLLAIDDLPGALEDPASVERFGSRGVRLQLSNPLLAAGVAAELSQQHPDWRIESWASSYGELFQAVRLEKALMFLILLLVVAVAAFNIVSGQMMIVTDKKSDIAILRTMGATASTIHRTFLLQGLIVSTFGILFGLLGGVLAANWISDLVAILKDWFGFGLLDGTFFVEVPSRVESMDLFLIGALSWSLCLFSAWLPARRAARLNPIEGLHS